ncbi:MAG TPA: DUF2264 domain-containing protein [Verrucomicrobiae bacterium]
MNNRRQFLKSVSTLSLAGLGSASWRSPAAEPAVAGNLVDDRGYWLSVLDRVASPVLTHLANRELKQRMPVEAANPAERAAFTHLEALGRTLAGLAPWLDATGLMPAEEHVRRKYATLVPAALDAATDPKSPDYLNFTTGGQPLVDAAFLAQAILRPPVSLQQHLDPRIRAQVIRALKTTREIGTPHGSNWVMFAAMVEAVLWQAGEKTIASRWEDCVEQMLGWYLGDGLYGDGEYFHADYYNSFVIHPMLLDVLAVLRQRSAHYGPVHDKALVRAQRYAAILERLIAPDGSYPSIGRSTTYRFGAFHSLGQIAWLDRLPANLKPAQVRSGLTAVIRRQIEAPGTFDEAGWLRIGFYGHQPALAEKYISTGSLYLCSTALLPLGLPPAHEFWSGPAAPWTARQLWSGDNLNPDHAIAET